MTLLAVLIALALEFLLPETSDYRPSHWLRGLMRWLRGRFRDAAFWRGWPGVVVVLAAAPFLVGLVAEGLDGSSGFSQALLLLFSAAVLAVCLRAREPWEAARAYWLGSQADEADLRERARAILGREPEGAADRWADQVMVALLSQATERLFGPLFWFVVLGPMGATLFYAAAVMKAAVGVAANPPDDAGERAFAEAALQAYQWLAAAPLRLLLLAYGLVGSFTDTLEGWRAHEFRCLGSVPDAQAALAVCAGYGALSMEPPGARSEEALPSDAADVAAVLGLQQRALVIWLALILLLWLIGLSV